MTRLKTKRLDLAVITTADADFVLELMNEPGWLSNIGDRGVRTVEDARDYVENGFAKSLWLVARDASGAPVGICGLVDREGLEGLDIGYAVLEHHAGQGYATELAAALLEHALKELGHGRLLAVTTPSNLASQRVLEKIGMHQLGPVTLPGRDDEALLYST